jgi:hypothetical protein
MAEINYDLDTLLRKKMVTMKIGWTSFCFDKMIYIKKAGK